MHRDAVVRMAVESGSPAVGTPGAGSLAHLLIFPPAGEPFEKKLGIETCPCVDGVVGLLLMASVTTSSDGPKAAQTSSPTLYGAVRRAIG